MIGLFLIVYLVIGFFVAKKYADLDSAEVFGAFMFLWPVLLLGSATEKVLKGLGFYHVVLKYIFVGIITVAVIVLISIQYLHLFRW